MVFMTLITILKIVTEITIVTIGRSPSMGSI